VTAKSTGDDLARFARHSDEPPCLSRAERPASQTLLARRTNATLPVMLMLRSIIGLNASSQPLSAYDVAVHESTMPTPLLSLA